MWPPWRSFSTVMTSNYSLLLGPWLKRRFIGFLDFLGAHFCCNVDSKILIYISYESVDSHTHPQGSSDLHSYIYMSAHECQEGTAGWLGSWWMIFFHACGSELEQEKKSDWTPTNRFVSSSVMNATLMVLQLRTLLSHFLLGLNVMQKKSYHYYLNRHNDMRNFFCWSGNFFIFIFPEKKI